MEYLIVTIFGLVIGSFLNVCIYRIPKGKSIVWPGSQCAQCDHKLAAWENIPVISYLLLRGKCSRCKKPISPRYIIVEILTAVVSVIAFATFPDIIDFIILVIFLYITIIITFIDLDYKVIPNRLLAIGLLPAIWPIVRDWDMIYLIGAIGLGIGFYVVAVLGELAFKKESMGMGDVKYAALIGLILGWKSGLVAVALAFSSATTLIILLYPFNKTGFGQRIPFGPFLSLGLFLSLIWGQNIIEWYISLVL